MGTLIPPSSPSDPVERAIDWAIDRIIEEVNFEGPDALVLGDAATLASAPMGIDDTAGLPWR